MGGGGRQGDSGFLPEPLYPRTRLPLPARRPPPGAPGRRSAAWSQPYRGSGRAAGPGGRAARISRWKCGRDGGWGGRICAVGLEKGVCDCAAGWTLQRCRGGGIIWRRGPRLCLVEKEGGRDAGLHRRAVPVPGRHVRTVCVRPCLSCLSPPGGRGRRGAHDRGEPAPAEPVAAKNCGSACTPGRVR